MNNSHGADGSWIVSARPDSIVNANDSAQAGWWAINTDGLIDNENDDNNNPITSDLVAVLGSPSSYYGTSQDLTTVTNFNSAHDVVDISATAFGWNGANSLLENVTSDGTGTAPWDVAVTASTSTTAYFTQAVFSSPVTAGKSVTYLAGTEHANVLVLSGVYANADAVAQTLGSPTGNTAITFDNGLALNYVGLQALHYAGHFIIAYQNQGGSTVLADLDISASQQIVYDTFSGVGAGGNGSTNGHYAGSPPKETIAVSDLVQLTGVTLYNLHATNIHFVA